MPPCLSMGSSWRPTRRNDSLAGSTTAAFLLVDGQLVAANQEERFTRRKHDGGFPSHAIRECLGTAGLTPGDVTVCVFAEKPLQSILFDRAKRPGGAPARVLGRMLPENAGGLYNRSEEHT